MVNCTDTCTDGLQHNLVFTCKNVHKHRTGLVSYWETKAKYSCIFRPSHFKLTKKQ